MNVMTFIKLTALDFLSVWREYPNVLIWCLVFGVILAIL